MAFRLLQQLGLGGCMSCSRRVVACLLFWIAFVCLSAFPSLYAQPNAGLIAYWPFNGNASDATGHALNGTVIGPTLAMDRFGQLESAYSFDGLNDYIEVPSSSGLNLNVNNGITFSYWIKTCAPSAIGVVMERFNKSVRYTGDSGWAVGTLPASDGGLSLNLAWSDEYAHDRAGLRPTLNDGKWHHVAVVVRPTTITFYVDGLFERLHIIDSTQHCCYNTNAPLRIGTGARGRSSSSLSSLSFFKGLLDDIKIYGRDLSETEVRALYNESAWPVSEPKLELQVQRLTSTTICIGGEVQLRVSHNGNGISWNTTKGVVNPNDEIVTLRPQTTTTYRISAYRPSYPCPDTVFKTDSVTVIVATPPKAVAWNTPYFSTCISDTTMLGGQTTGGLPPYRWQWSPAEGLDNPNVEHPKLIGGTPGRHRYRVVVTDSKGCKDSAEVAVILFPSPTFSLGTDTVYYCPGTGIRIGATADSSTRPTKYTWSPSTGLDRNDIPFVTASPKVPTRYVLTVENVTGCIVRDSVMVIPSPENINVGEDVLTCSGTPVFIGTSPQPGIIYQWSPEIGLSDPSASRTEAMPAMTTLYRLTASDPRTGCVVTDSILVRVYDEQLSIDRGAINFGTLRSCSSDSTVTVWITNKGRTPVRIDKWSSEDPSFRFLEETLSIPAGRTVAANIRYAPLEEGVHRGTMSLQFGSCAQVLLLELSGSKQKDGIELIPPAISFPPLLSCSMRSIDTALTVINSGTDPLIIRGVTVPAAFAVRDLFLPIIIPAGQNISIKLQYMPTGAGNFAGNLELTYESQECRNVLPVPLSAIVQSPLAETDIKKIDFGTLEGCLFERDTTISLRNKTSADIIITDAVLPQGYRLENRVPLTIPANDSVELNLHFLPSGNGRFAGALQLQSEPCALSTLITLEGERQGVWFTLPDTIDFGELVSCAELQKKLPLHLLYNGEGEGRITGITLSGPFATTLSEGSILPNGSEQTFDVLFTPSQEGEYIGELLLVLDPCDLPRRIVLRGKATRLELDGGSYALSIASGKTPVTADILFRNTGSAAARVEQVQGIIPPFTLLGTTPSLPATLQPNEELRVTVRYVPSPGKTQSPVQVVMVAPCPLTTQAIIYANGDPGPGTAETPSGSHQ